MNLWPDSTGHSGGHCTPGGFCQCMTPALPASISAFSAQFKVFHLVHTEHSRHEDTVIFPVMNAWFPNRAGQQTLEHAQHHEVCTLTSRNPVVWQKRKEKTTPFGDNLLRSQVLYRAAQVCFLVVVSADKSITGFVSSPVDACCATTLCHPSCSLGEKVCKVHSLGKQI